MPASAVASVVIPAHDEAQVIEETLRTLLTGLEPGTLEVVVVCNGCSDDTARRARAFPGVTVLEVPEPSKARAVEAGSRAARAFPRVHLDADVAISGTDVLELIAPIRAGAVLATGPRRTLPLGGCSPVVRAYYEVWQALPHVREGLFGRGVVALSETGQARVAVRGLLMNDDLVMSAAFLPPERRVVSTAAVVVHPPRTTGDLLRRRTRVATGNAQAAASGVNVPQSSTTWVTLAGLCLRHPRLALRVPVFLGVGWMARLRSRHAVRVGDYSTWLRDDSSRARTGRT